MIPEDCNFGYDIIVFIGKSLFLRCRNYQEIRLELQRRNISTVNHQRQKLWEWAEMASRLVEGSVHA